MRCLFLTLAMSLCVAPAQVVTLFEDTFAVPGPRPNIALWTTETGDTSFLPPTQLTNWLPGANGVFNVTGDGARLVLDTFNPTGNPVGTTFQGTHAKTIATFQPAANRAIELTVRMQLTTLQRGLVYGIYFYACPASGNCSQNHDEIDIELLTNYLQPGATPRVNLNRYANEPQGVGRPRAVDLPAGFDPLAAHNWTIRWSGNRIDYLVDGILLGFDTTFVPQGRMSANVIAWAPPSGWTEAYHSSLLPAANAGTNQSLAALVKSVSVREITTTPRLRYVPLTPCRVLETRALYNAEGRTGAFGPPAFTPGETRTINLPASQACNIPEAKAYVVNATLLPHTFVDFVTLYPAGELRPDTWTVRSLDGQIVANSTIVKANNGSIQVHVTQAADLLLDVTGYFTDSSPTQTNLVFYPVTPCRAVDTRVLYSNAPAPFGPPTMNAGETRRIRIPSAPGCQIPAGATAYSFNLTVVPPAPLAFMTVWPSGTPQPGVSSINSFNARTLTNQVIIPAGNNDSIDVFAYNGTDFLIDVNGYFAPDDGSRGLYYHPVTQARIFDSRKPDGICGGPVFGNEISRTVPVPGCSGTPAALAWHLTTSALPASNPMPYLTAWPAGVSRPVASILNAFEGQVVANSAIVPAGSNGAVDIFTYRQTHVTADLNGYFAR